MLRQSLFPRWYVSRLTTDGSKLAFFLQLQEEPKPAYLFKQPVKHPYLLMMRKILIGQLAEVSIPVYENCWIASQCIDLWPCDHWSEAQLWGCSVNSFFEKQKKKNKYCNGGAWRCSSLYFIDDTELALRNITKLVNICWRQPSLPRNKEPFFSLPLSAIKDSLFENDRI